MDDHMTDGTLNVAALFSVLHRFGGPRGRIPATLCDWWPIRNATRRPWRSLDGIPLSLDAKAILVLDH